MIRRDEMFRLYSVRQEEKKVRRICISDVEQFINGEIVGSSRH